MRFSFFLSLVIVLLFSSCVRDLTCECYKKKGARLLFAIQTDSTNTFIAEKRRYFPTQDYDLDTGHKAVMKQMRKKYDSISHITKTTFFIGVQDSFGFDTLRVRGAELSRCRDKGYTYKCWE